MKLLTAYLLRAFVLALVFVTLAVTAAVWLTQSLRYVDVVVENGAPLHMFAWLALLTLPVFLGLTVPIALFVAVLFTFNRLTQDSELIAMRACGMSPRALARPALLLAFWMTGLGFLLTLWIQPLANQELARLQYFVQSQFSAALLKEGAFNDLGNRMTVYVARRERNAELRGLLIHDERNPDRPVTIQAARGQMVQGPSGPQVIVEDGVQQEYNRTTHRLSTLSFDSYAVSLHTLVPDTAPRNMAPRERTTAALFRDRQTDPDDAMRPRLTSELHQRLTTPLLSLAFVLIACCCLLFGEFNRRGQMKRVVLAVSLAGLVQAATLGLVRSAGGGGLSALPLYLSVWGPILVGLLILIRADRVPLPRRTPPRPAHGRR